MTHHEDQTVSSPSLTGTNSSSQLADDKVESYPADEVWPPQDTVHYLSPVTTARTVCEGDFDYTHFTSFMDKEAVPTYSPETSISCDEPKVQRTLAIIKPEAMIYKDVVLRAVIDNGFSIVGQRTVTLTPEQVAEIYAQRYGCPSFPNMVVSMSIGPLLVLSLARFNAVEKWKSMVGPYKALQAEWFLPYNVRMRYGLHVDIHEVLHASENVTDAKKENRYFYPDSVLEPIPCSQQKVEDYCNLNVNPTLVKGLVELVRKKPADPVIFLAEWLLLNNPFRPNASKDYAVVET